MPAIPDVVLAGRLEQVQLRDWLVASTRLGRETSGTCALRAATNEERATAALGEQSAGVVSDLWRTRTGEATSVPLDDSVGPGRIHVHTHPGLVFAVAAFSDGDFAAVRLTGVPLMVIGYSVLSPEFASTALMPLGWPGLLAGLGVQGVLRLEAEGLLPSSLLRASVVAKVLFPGGRVVPVVAAEASPVRRTWERATFASDQAVSQADRVARRWLRAVSVKLRVG